MRGIYGLIFGLGLAGLLTGTIVSAQDAAKPMAIQVVVGPDGVVKILDAKTGKEVAGAGVIKIQAQHGQIQVQGQGQGLDKKQLEELHRMLEKLLKEGQGPKADVKKPIQFELELQVKPDDPNAKKQIIKIEKIHGVGGFPAGGVDKKLDLILKQLEDLRRDVDGIKKKLDGPKAEKVQIFRFDAAPANPDAPKGLIVPLPPQGKDVDKKPAGIRFQLVPAPDKANDAKDEVRQRLLDALKKLDSGGPNLPPAPTHEAKGVEDLQRALEQVRRQLDEIQSELKKAKERGK